MPTVEVWSDCGRDRVVTLAEASYLSRLRQGDELLPKRRMTDALEAPSHNLARMERRVLAELCRSLDERRDRCA